MIRREINVILKFFVVLFMVAMPISTARSADELSLALASAVEIGDIDRVRSLLAAGASPHASTPDAWPPVTIACSMLATEREGTAQGRAWRDIIERLLLAGADPNAADTLGTTALHVGGNDPRCVAPLLAARADPNRLAAFERPENGLLEAKVAPLETAIAEVNSPAQVEGIRVLIAGGADPNRLTHDGLTLKRLVADRLAEQLNTVDNVPPFEAIWPGNEWWRSKLALYELLDSLGVSDQEADTTFASLRRTAIGRYGSGKKEKATNVSDWWSSTADKIVSVIGVSIDAKVTLDGGCNARFEPGFLGTLHRYRGDKLRRNVNVSEKVVFDVSGPGNKTASFRTSMHYYLPERAWVITNALPVAFIDAFARGRSLTIRNDAGEDVAVFGLRGSARAVAEMRKICHIPIE